MRVFRNKWFTRFADKNDLSDEALWKAIADAESGLIDADLGGGLIKQRIARKGEGKSGGFRAIVVFRAKSRAFFVYGFPKSARDNIDDDELAAFKALASEVLAYDDKELETAVEAGVWMEVKGNG